MTEDIVVDVNCIEHSYLDGVKVDICGLEFQVRRGQRVAVLGVVEGEHGDRRRPAVEQGQVGHEAQRRSGARGRARSGFSRGSVDPEAPNRRAACGSGLRSRW